MPCNNSDNENRQCSANTNITKGDDLQAFNGQPIKITIVNPTDEPVKIAYVVINNGAIVKEYPNPEDVILVKLDSIDTNKLSFKNTMKLIAIDSKGRKRTCNGELVFETNKEVWHVTPKK